MLIRRLLTYSLLSLVALGGFLGSVHIETENQGHDIVSVSYEGNGVYADGGCPWSELPDGMWSCPSGATNSNDKWTGETTKASSAEQLKMWNSLIDGLNIILGIITAIVSPAIMFAGWLMSPDWTSGDLFGLRTPMYSLWVTVSNIVYFVYAILLILIALGTMFGKESFSYKVMLPKLALGILMVPFTWWFVQWTISLSAVVTASVITIPAETLGSKDGTSWADTPSIPKDITIDASNGDKPKDKPIIPCSKDTCMTPAKFLKDWSGMYGYMMVYAYSIFKFDQVTQIPQWLDILKTGLGIVHQGVVAAIMFLVFGLLTLALVSMLLVRAIKLWVYAIFSPLFTFQFVAGAAMMWGDKDTFTIKEFVGLCFVPAIVGLALSFWLILINAVSSATPWANTATCNISKLKSDVWCQLVSIMGNSNNNITRKIKWTEPNIITQNIVNFGGIAMTFNGKAGASTDQAAMDGANSVTGVLNSAGGIFGTLIIDIIALVFIWMAFMAAKNVSKAVAMAVEPFEKIGQQVGSLAKSIPKYTPIPGLGMSAAGIGKTVELGTSKIDTILKKKTEWDVGKLFPTLVEGIINAEKEAKLKQDLWNILSSTPIDQKIGKATSAVSEAQSGAQYSANNMSKLVDAIKDKFNNSNTDELKKYFDSHGIKRDSKESEAMIKMYTWVAMSENEKMLAWGANTRLWTSSSTSPIGATNFTFKINGSESMPINPAGTATEIAKQLAWNTLIDEKKIIDGLKTTSLQDKTEEIIKAFKEIKAKSKSSWGWA
jgi:hypothetical protein